MLLLQSVRDKRVFRVWAVLLCVAFAVNTYSSQNVQNIFSDKITENLVFTKDTKIPVFVICRNFWKYADLVPYLHDAQTYIFIDNIADILEYTYPSFYVVIENDSELIEQIASINKLDFQIGDRKEIPFESDYVEYEPSVQNYFSYIQVTQKRK
ncbi:hypothetical protein NO1_1434 [Candidatus Termititenax aidoneus]|uniref:Uncharacterized protein n=1 Tax=Termititenax aidoneus TaxID=2218524 RepID=A0A388TCK6_TERA1|nr:hypothetical protein NO1_1434 [Candidatus Termititenax aidoneus]